MLKQFLFFGFNAALQLLDIFLSGKLFGLDTALTDHIAYAAVILLVFAGDWGFGMQLLLHDVVVGHFGSKIL